MWIHKCSGTCSSGGLARANRSCRGILIYLTVHPLGVADLVALWHRKRLAREAFSIVGWGACWQRIADPIGDLGKQIIDEPTTDICVLGLTLSPFCWYSVSSQLFYRNKCVSRLYVGNRLLAVFLVLGDHYRRTAFFFAVLPDNKEDLLDSAC